MKRQYSKRLMPGVFFGRNSGGWLMLIRLPFGYGLNIGTGFSGYWSLRSWILSKYDYADHFSFEGSFNSWMKQPKGSNH